MVMVIVMGGGGVLTQSVEVFLFNDGLCALSFDPLRSPFHKLIPGVPFNSVT